MTTEYEIVKAPIGRLEDEVKHHLAEGWQLHGVTIAESGNGWAGQAMVRTVQNTSHEIIERLWRVEKLLHAILNKEKHMSVELDTLTAQVAANNDLAASAVALIQGLASQIEAAKDDPAKLQALADSLRASDAPLAAAIAANTPAAPTP